MRRLRNKYTAQGFQCLLVFSKLLLNIPQLAGNSNVTLIGTVAQGLFYLDATFSAAVIKHFPKYQQL